MRGMHHVGSLGLGLKRFFFLFEDGLFVSDHCGCFSICFERQQVHHSIDIQPVAVPFSSLSPKDPGASKQVSAKARNPGPGEYNPNLISSDANGANTQFVSGTDRLAPANPASTQFGASDVYDVLCSYSAASQLFPSPSPGGPSSGHQNLDSR